jgi:hypothetical protein
MMKSAQPNTLPWSTHIPSLLCIKTFVDYLLGTVHVVGNSDLGFCNCHLVWKETCKLFDEGNSDTDIH